MKRLKKVGWTESGELAIISGFKQCIKNFSLWWDLLFRDEYWWANTGYFYEQLSSVKSNPSLVDEDDDDYDPIPF